jgi:hypothetical protein
MIPVNTQGTRPALVGASLRRRSPVTVSSQRDLSDTSTIWLHGTQIRNEQRPLPRSIRVPLLQPDAAATAAAETASVAATSGVMACSVSSRARAAALAFGVGVWSWAGHIPVSFLPSGHACAGAFFGRSLETGLAQASFNDLWQGFNRFSRSPFSARRELH